MLLGSLILKEPILLFVSIILICSAGNIHSSGFSCDNFPQHCRKPNFQQNLSGGYDYPYILSQIFKKICMNVNNIFPTILCLILGSVSSHLLIWCEPNVRVENWGNFLNYPPSFARHRCRQNEKSGNFLKEREALNWCQGFVLRLIG